MTAFDVVIAGGGIAGASVAAALGELGYAVLLVEPGLDSAKRLAGELIHPPGVSDLAELGLLAPLETTGVMPVLGFAVLPDAGSAPYLLPYGQIPGVRAGGFAIDHAALRPVLLAAAERLPHVTTWRDARVTALDQDAARGERGRVIVTIAGRGAERRVSTRLVVGADGAASPVRRLAGIRHTRVHISRMLSVQVAGSPPCPGWGNVFLGGPAPALAYAIGPDTVRVMFDVPDNEHGIEAVRRDPAWVAALPEPFRRRVREALGARGALVAANVTGVPETVTRGRVVLVGDAAGCCHPLTATGLSVCTRDAIRLRDALRASPHDLPLALGRYAARRRRPEKTRRALADALYTVFLARTPETRLMRQGLLRCWAASPRSRATSMALLSTRETRTSIMALEYARVVRHTLQGLLLRRGPARDEWRSRAARARAALTLSLATLRHARASLWALRS